MTCFREVEDPVVAGSEQGKLVMNVCMYQKHVWLQKVLFMY